MVGFDETDAGGSPHDSTAAQETEDRIVQLMSQSPDGETYEDLVEWCKSFDTETEPPFVDFPDGINYSAGKSTAGRLGLNGNGRGNLYSRVAWALYHHRYGTESIDLPALADDDDLAPLIVELAQSPACSFAHLKSTLSDMAHIDDSVDTERFLPVNGIPRPTHTIEGLRASDVDTMVVIEATVTHRTSTRTRIYQAHGKCSDCQYDGHVIQPWFTDELETEQCDYSQCERELTFDPQDAGHRTHEVQDLVVQDLHRHVDVAEPADCRVILSDSLVDSVESGDEVRIAAAVMRDTSHGAKTADFVLRAVGVEHADVDYSSLDVSEEQREHAEGIVSQEDYYSTAAASIDPTLEAVDDHASGDQIAMGRRAVLYQLAGAYTSESGRGTIHVAMVGDPGTGKSSIAEFASEVAPKSINVDTETVTPVGLTAGVVKDDRVAAEYTVSGGALVRANGGLCFIDELDKGGKALHNSLHSALSSGKVELSKANIRATLRAETDVLVTANPDGQRFSPHEPITDQIGIEDALFSRFDLVVPFFDRPNEEADAAAMNKLVKEAQRAEGEDVDDNTIPVSDLRLILSIARSIEPSLTVDAAKHMQAEFQRLRGQSSANRISVTVRQGEALRRLAIASARLRLSDEVEIEDAERAVTLLESSLQMVASDQHGNLDADALSAGPTASQREDCESVIEALSELQSESGGNIVEGRIIEVMQDEHEFPPTRTRMALKRLQKDNSVWRNQHGYGVSGQ
ncbi:AAA family ATPase [Halomarina salina]|uniref:AAA family ATPase n=1 Tax=Halomarina salina TaxID=1872699 RepID=A0ABD5RPI8_9EURY|nr:AAA family ATPase [Halomarina salina]